MVVKYRTDPGTQSTDQALSKSAIKGTAMLLTVSFAFIILTGPIAIANAIYENNIQILVFVATSTLEYLNHGMNCLLYCISGSRFRNELKKTLGCRKKPMNQPSGNTRSTSVLNSTSLTNLRTTASPK